jgi:glucose-6-phosphate 1-epimerase
LHELKKFSNGFEYIEINNDSACGKIALQGAHLFHFARKNDAPILWTSETSDFEIGKAIRGGVPVCWPSFGINNPDLPQHGFARLGMWKLLEIKEMDAKTTKVTLELNDTQESMQLWAYRFKLTLTCTISEKLIMELTTTNLDAKPFKITQALHSYFEISDISNIAVSGLSGKPYLDALTGEYCKQEGDITFDKETDSVYQEVKSEIRLRDKNRTICILNEGSSSAVIWNPWIEKCKRMGGMRDDAYHNFVCIESANAYEDFKIIESGKSHTLKATIY